MTPDLQFRFSLLGIFALTTAIAVLSAVLFVVPSPVSGMIVIVVLSLLPVVLIAGIVWGRPHVRAFCVGAIIPSAITFMTLAPVWLLTLYFDTHTFTSDGIFRRLDRYDSEHRVLLGVCIAFTVLSGATTLIVRRFVFRK